MTRTLLIGLDGATFHVLDPLTREIPGEGVVMPFMARVFAEGARARLRSTPNPLTPPAWVSLQTGRSPGNHGVFEFLRAEEKGDTIQFTLYDSRDVRTETIWSIASRQDRSVAALNFPITAPPRPVNGFVIPGFVPWRHLRRNVYPAELFDRLKKIPGFEPKELAWDFEQEEKALDDLGENETEQWIRYHLPREEQWYRIASRLLQDDSPDLMAIMFDGTDKIQHQAWPFLDPDLAGSNDSDWGRRMVSLCHEYFRRLDSYIEGLVELAGPDCQVFFASDHGFTASTETVRINAFLNQKGYLNWRQPDAANPGQWKGNWFKKVDWDHTVAYCRTAASNGIKIRVEQQPGDGGIPAAQYEQFRDRLIADLESLRDEATGERIIKEIYRREEIFAGPAMDQAPDVCMVLRDHGFVSILEGEPIVEPRPVPVGTHHPDGVFMAYGRGVRAGVEIDRCNVMDVAAVVLHSLGLPVPEDFEGRVPGDLFTEEALARNPVRKGEATRAVQEKSARSEDISEDEKAKILEQLQMLGYME